MESAAYPKPSTTFYNPGITQQSDWKTRWSLILSRQSEDPVAAAQALEELLRQYRGLLVRYTACRVPRQDAEDVVHDFMIQVMSDKLLQRADPQKGAFRAFVRTALDQFLADHARRSRAQKRSPGGKEEQLEVMAESRRDSESDPGDLYDLCWFTELVETSRRKLWAEDSVEWTIAEVALLHVPRSEAAARHGLSSAQISELLRKVRRELRDKVQEQLKQLCGNHSVYQQEWEALSRFARNA